MTSEAPDELLRPAIELAFMVALGASRSHPTVRVPPPLRPFLKLTRLPERALRPVRRVVDNDEAFRELLLPAATEEVVGRAGWLWLHRPDGWETELSELVEATEVAREAQGDEREATAAARRLEVMQAALDQARQRASNAEAEVVRLRAELADVRRELAPPPSAPSSSEPSSSDVAVDPPPTRQASAVPESSPPAPRPVAKPNAPLRRSPVVVPGGLSLRAREGVEAALRTPDLLLVVDGYNVTLRAWPELELAEQRHRLLDVLEELGSRFKVHPVVIFDGASLVAGAGSRRYVHVQFSHHDVTADDELIEMVRGLPTTTPVLAVTGDQALRRRLTGLGAESIDSDALLAVVRRLPDR
ncbi:MAG: hypothetical protein JWL70_3201 [Acidimicrobiia bacterium]|nr:hypothetical protein [Acidimicrobiia bacterium]